MNPSTSAPLLQRAAAQTQANRYALLRKAADSKLVEKIVNK